MDQLFILHKGTAVGFVYRNWRGKTAMRHAVIEEVWYGTTKWHPEPQFFLNAWDIAKQEWRHFALGEMSDLKYVSYNGRVGD